jgi:hypothetical protein
MLSEIAASSERGTPTIASFPKVARQATPASMAETTPELSSTHRRLQA